MEMIDCLTNGFNGFVPNETAAVPNRGCKGSPANAVLSTIPIHTVPRSRNCLVDRQKRFASIEPR